MNSLLNQFLDGSSCKISVISISASGLLYLATLYTTRLRGGRSAYRRKDFLCVRYNGVTTNISHQLLWRRIVSNSICPSVSSFVRLSLCLLCLSGAFILWGEERTAKFHINIWGGDKIRDQPINTRNLVS